MTKDEARAIIREAWDRHLGDVLDEIATEQEVWEEARTLAADALHDDGRPYDGRWIDEITNEGFTL